MKRPFKKKVKKKHTLFIILLIIFVVILFFIVRSKSSLENQWAFEKIHLKEAWKITKGKGAKIAVIDSGFDLNDDEKKVVYIDYEDSLESGPEDIIGHGTKTASLIAAVCPQCQLILIKLGTQSEPVVVANAIHKAVDEGANVINLSFATNMQDNFIKDEIERAHEMDVLIVAAAGNQNTFQNRFPAGYKYVDAVAATDESDKKALFSNYGRKIIFAAPGVNIQTKGKNGKYDRSSGTSFAAPIVSGVAGLVWASKYGTSVDAVNKRLCDTADKIKGTGSYWKCGRINAGRAVGAIQ